MNRNHFGDAVPIFPRSLDVLADFRLGGGKAQDEVDVRVIFRVGLWVWDLDDPKARDQHTKSEFDLIQERFDHLTNDSGAWRFPLTTLEIKGKGRVPVPWCPRREERCPRLLSSKVETSLSVNLVFLLPLVALRAPIGRRAQNPSRLMGALRLIKRGTPRLGHGAHSS